MQNEPSSKIKSASSKSTSPKANNSDRYQFKPIRYLKLHEVYKQIKDLEIKLQNESMFPPNFSQTYNAELATYLFEIQVSDQYKKWTIVKRLPQLIDLQQTLNNQFPQEPLIFSFPPTQQSQISEMYASSILELFIAFLTSISKSSQIPNDKHFQLFLQNWTPPSNKKIVTYFQKNLAKKAGGRHTESSLSRIMNNFISWRRKFFTITNEGVYYTDDEDSFNVKEMIMFNQSFNIQHGQVKTGYTFGLMLNSSHRVLQIDAQNIFNFLLFLFYLRKVISQGQNSQTNHFNSFAPARVDSCSSRFYIDGKDYFKAVYTELKKAKNQIFITGWIVTPHLYLIQSFQTLEYRIDKVLEKLAFQGVKVYIIIYNAPRIAIDINPQFSQSYLKSLHPNIKVLRHPNYMFIPFLWSHHEKIVIIDQKVAFTGGLDLGYGRMDDNLHLISDEKQQLWKGIDYCNYRTRDLSDITMHQNSQIDRLTQPRMPWHDVGIKLSGPSVIDLCKHFMQYWNYANHQLYLTERQLLMFTGIHEQQLQSFEEILDLPDKIQIDQIQNTYLQEVPFSKVLNNQELIKSDKKKKRAQKSPSNSKFISFVQGSSIMYDDLPQLKKLKSTDLISSSAEQSKQAQKEYYLTYLKNNAQKSTVFNVQLSKQFFIDEKVQKQNIQTFEIKDEGGISELKLSNLSQMNKSKQTHQILRSASLWSLGIEQGKHEKSILEAYISLIQNSKNFIYIQNQFFISVENPIADKLVERIMKAVESKENFKLVIMIPFLPGFSGQIQDQSSAVMRVQMDLIYKTICRGDRSILGQLKQIGNIEDYLGIYCLRTHGLVSGLPATEIVYIHSKVMIVDDRVALIGSANINDRSLMGDRDSEIAIIVEDSEQIQISNESLGLPTLKVKKIAHQLRKNLYMEHFALSETEAEHFLDFNVWDKMLFNAERNQKTYRKIFGCYPDNGIKNFSDIKTFRQQAELDRYDELKALIKGFACPFQTEFLSNESLELHSGQKQYYVPFINFT